MLFQLKSRRFGKSSEAFPKLHSEHILCGVDVVVVAPLQMEVILLIASNMITNAHFHANDVVGKVTG